MPVMKRGASKYWYVQFQLGGRTYIRSSKSQDKRIAEALEAQWRREILLSTTKPTRPQSTLSAAAEAYLAAREGLPSHIHLKRYARYLTEYFGHAKLLHDINSRDLEALKGHFQREGYAPQSIKHLLNTIHGIISHAKRMGFRISHLSYPTVRVPKTRLRYLSQDEERRLLAALEPTRMVKGLPAFQHRTAKLIAEMQDIYDLVILLLDTGARYGEIASLRWTQIDFDQNVIGLWRPKVQNQSVLFMTRRVAAILQRRILSRQGDYVFSNSTGGPRNYTAASLRRCFDRAGLTDCSVHTLRHTYATRLIQNGMTIHEVRELLGHSDIKTTMRYAHLESASISRRALDVIEAGPKFNKPEENPQP